MHPLVDVRLSSFPLETFWIILFVVFMETYSTLLSLQQIQRNRTHTHKHTHRLNHQVSKSSSFSSTIWLHSKLLLSHSSSRISTRRISLQRHGTGPHPAKRRLWWMGDQYWHGVWTISSGSSWPAVFVPPGLIFGKLSLLPGCVASSKVLLCRSIKTLNTKQCNQLLYNNNKVKKIRRCDALRSIITADTCHHPWTSV